MLAGMARPKRLHLLTGRPSRYTIEVATEILTRMAEGGSLHRICQDEHLPAAARLADNGRHPAFVDAFRRARRHQAYRWFEQTVEIADESQAAETVPEIGSFQLRVRALQWAASRLAPDEFGDQVQH
jgi:Bacteriophage Sf6, terminase small subunit-like